MQVERRQRTQVCCCAQPSVKNGHARPPHRILNGEHHATAEEVHDVLR